MGCVVSPALSGVLSGGSFVPPNGLYPVACGCSGDVAVAPEDAGAGDGEGADDTRLAPNADVGWKPVYCGVSADGLVAPPLAFEPAPPPNSLASVAPNDDVGWNGLTDEPPKPVV